MLTLGPESLTWMSEIITVITMYILHGIVEKKSVLKEKRKAVESAFSSRTTILYDIKIENEEDQYLFDHVIIAKHGVFAFSKASGKAHPGEGKMVVGNLCAVSLPHRFQDKNKRMACDELTKMLQMDYRVDIFFIQRHLDDEDINEDNYIRNMQVIIDKLRSWSKTRLDPLRIDEVSKSIRMKVKV